MPQLEDLYPHIADQISAGRGQAIAAGYTEDEYNSAMDAAIGRAAAQRVQEHLRSGKTQAQAHLQTLKDLGGLPEDHPIADTLREGIKDFSRKAMNYIQGPQPPMNGDPVQMAEYAKASLEPGHLNTDLNPANWMDVVGRGIGYAADATGLPQAAERNVSDYVSKHTLPDRQETPEVLKARANSGRMAGAIAKKTLFSNEPTPGLDPLDQQVSSLFAQVVQAPLFMAGEKALTSERPAPANYDIQDFENLFPDLGNGKPSQLPKQPITPSPDLLKILDEFKTPQLPSEPLPDNAPLNRGGADGGSRPELPRGANKRLGKIKDSADVMRQPLPEVPESSSDIAKLLPQDSVVTDVRERTPGGTAIDPVTSSRDLAPADLSIPSDYERSLNARAYRYLTGEQLTARGETLKPLYHPDHPGLPAAQRSLVEQLRAHDAQYAFPFEGDSKGLTAPGLDPNFDPPVMQRVLGANDLHPDAPVSGVKAGEKQLKLPLGREQMAMPFEGQSSGRKAPSETVDPMGWLLEQLDGGEKQGNLSDYFRKEYRSGRPEAIEAYPQAGAATDRPGVNVPENQSLSKFEDADPETAQFNREQARTLARGIESEELKPSPRDYLSPKAQTREVVPSNELSRKEQLNRKHGLRLNTQADAAYQERNRAPGVGLGASSYGPEVPRTVGASTSPEMIAAADVSRMHMPSDPVGPAEGIIPHNRLGERIDPRLAEQRLQQGLRTIRPEDDEIEYLKGMGNEHTLDGRYITASDRGSPNAQMEFLSEESAKKAFADLQARKETLGPRDVVKKAWDDFERGSFSTKKGTPLSDTIAKTLNSPESKAVHAARVQFAGDLSASATKLDALNVRMKGRSASERYAALKGMQSDLFNRALKNGVETIRAADPKLSFNDAKAYLNVGDYAKGALEGALDRIKAGRFVGSPKALLADQILHIAGDAVTLTDPSRKFRLAFGLEKLPAKRLKMLTEAGAIGKDSLAGFDHSELNKLGRQVWAEGSSTKKIMAGVANLTDIALAKAAWLPDHLLANARLAAADTEMTRLVKGGMSETEAAKQAARYADKFYQKYPPDMPRWLGQRGANSPLFKAFVNASIGFPINAVRIYGNMLTHSPRTAATAFAMAGAVAAGIKGYYTNVSDDEYEAAIRALPPKNRFMARWGAVPIKDEKGKIKFRDISYYVALLDMVVGYKFDPAASPKDKITAVLSQASKNLTQRGIFSGVSEALTDKNPTKPDLADALENTIQGGITKDHLAQIANSDILGGMLPPIVPQGLKMGLSKPFETSGMSQAERYERDVIDYFAKNLSENEDILSQKQLKREYGENKGNIRAIFDPTRNASLSPEDRQRMIQRQLEVINRRETE